MPKPTTHTDIVIVTKQDPSTRGTESIQLTLAANGAQTKIYGHSDPVDTGSGSLASLPYVGLQVDLGGKTVELIYQGRLRHQYSRSRTSSDPRPSGDVPTPSNPKTFKWRNDASDALITDFELLVYATLEGAPLDIEVKSSSSSTTQHVGLEFKYGSTVVGHLTIIAVMDALPMF